MLFKSTPHSGPVSSLFLKMSAFMLIFLLSLAPVLTVLAEELPQESETSISENHSESETLTPQEEIPVVEESEQEDVSQEENNEIEEDNIADGAKLLNPGIQNVDSAINSHIIPRHTDSGIMRYSERSKFDSGVDVKSLINQSTQMPMTRSGSNFLRTFDTGKDIGVVGKGLENAGSRTSIMTVVTDKINNLITAYPGGPGKIK